MARSGFVSLTTEDEVLFYKALKSGDRFTFSKINKKLAFYTRKRKAGLSSRSLLPAIAAAWDLLSGAVKADWKAAAALMNLNGWQLFVQDKTIRIINDIVGNADPNLLHQSWVGYLNVEDPASEIKITQLHPHDYWVSQKVGGKKGMYQPVKVTEDFALPLVIQLNYKSDLTSVAAGSFAKFYARVWHSYQGLDCLTNLEIPLDLQTDWKQASATLASVKGYVVGYTLFVHLSGLRGTLWCDNIKATHSSQNWVRDTYCKDMNQGFTRAFYQIPKHWVGLILPSGSEYGSVYP